MFTDTMRIWLESITDLKNQFNLIRLFYPLYDTMSSQILTSAGAGLTISGTTTLVKNATAFYYLANGVLGTVAANTNMAALVGSVANATYNVFCFYVDSAGTLTTAMGVAGVSLATLKFPQKPEGKTCIGFVIINPTGTGPFVGGTTALTDGTVVPNAVYVSTDGGSDAFCLTGLTTTP